MSFDYNSVAARIQGEFQKIGENSVAAPSGESKEGFSDLLKGILNETDDLQVQAGEAVNQLMSGEKQNVHEVMLSMAKADVSFRMMLEVRNKLVEAYQEVMRMSV